MRFAQRLDEEAIPEWRLKYVNYAFLKTLIEKIPPNPFVTNQQPTVVSFLTGTLPNSRRDSELERIRQRPLVEEEQAFLDRIEKELAQVDEFYLAREREAIDRKYKILAQLQVLPESFRSKGSEYSFASTLVNSEEEGENQLTVSSHGDSVHSTDQLTTAPPPSSSYSPTKKKQNLEHAKIHTIRRTSFSKLARYRIKKALLEYYRSLELLKSYRALNYQAFGKIFKKFDKKTGRKLSTKWLDDIRAHPFCASPSLDNLAIDVENLYSHVFTHGDRGKALRKLRILDLKQETFYGPAVCAGSCFGISIALVMAIVYRVFSSGTPVQHTLFYLYGGIFLPLFMGCLFAINMAIWERHHINYRFIFEYNQRNMLHVAQYMVFSSTLLLAYLGFAFASISGVFNGILRPFLQPWIPLVSLVLFFIIPIPIFYSSTRHWFSKVNFRILMGPFYPVQFKDFFLNDQFMSLGYFFQTLGWLLQLSLDTSAEARASYVVTFRRNWYVILLGLIPATGRIFQCGRRYVDTKMWFPHLANMAKYFFSFAVIALPDATPYSLKLLLLVLSSLFSLGWDIVMDFGFLQKNSQVPLLRSNLLFGTPAIYYFLIVADCLARFLWIGREILPEYAPKFISNSNNAKLPTIALVLALAIIEVLRRIMWNFFRVEYEQINNCNCFKAVKDITLPFLNTGDLFYHDMVKELASRQVDNDIAVEEERSAGAPVMEQVSFEEEEAGEAKTCNESPRKDSGELNSILQGSTVLDIQQVSGGWASRNAIRPSELKNSGWGSHERLVLREGQGVNVAVPK